MIGGGILAIWNDCVSGREGIYERWYQGEHLAERLDIPGFLRGRRYHALDGSKPEYFTYYETTVPEVLTGIAYLEHVDNPTPLTASVMADTLIHMSRTVCRVTESVGRMRGSIAVTVKLTDAAGVGDRLTTLIDDRGVARAELWIAVKDRAWPVSREEALRGGDDKIEACLFVETLRAETAFRVVDELAYRFSGVVSETGLYRLLCECTREEIS